ncbi:gamma-glutamylcyclotransferase [Spirosoma taeanense]|uniref:Gamma-glutamylcyclotransferase n=1 Tax=Spirosoma taeanense TaxID=2735870 RepID=A0A6M5YFI8_9BACT|nr:gamma-glutamylcyclotransferase family protein [Spirosoma taeanense]QJW92080.1 gamma-glutamylcyclotransferase [Spirosoma taeanense]
MADDSDFLIVYGTLRPGFTNSPAQYLRQHSQYVGEGTFPGLLVDLGTYPGALYQPDSQTRVWGTVYQLGNDKYQLLDRLDEYEGVGESFQQPTEYVRTLIPVRCGTETLTCWVYLYNLSTDGNLCIQSGDYVTYCLERITINNSNL